VRQLISRSCTGCGQAISDTFPSQKKILFHMRRARFNEQAQVIENRELAALRQYGAACLLDKGRLQMLPVS
jgi:hypothetical protein